MFLKRLKERESSTGEAHGEVVCEDEFTSEDGKTKKHVLFKESLDEVNPQSIGFTSNFGGVFLTFGFLSLDSMVSKSQFYPSQKNIY